MRMANLVALAVIPAGLLALASCDSGSKQPAVQTKHAVTTEKGVPGGKWTKTQTAVATVDYVKNSTREVTLQMADGTKRTIKCGPQVRNFDQIREGDKVTITYTQELQAFMAKGSEPAADMVSAGGIRAPEGAMPAAAAVAEVQRTATIMAIDMDKHTATLKFADGSTQTIAVRPDVDLSQRKVGDQITVLAMEGVAISVERR